jgi:hypothetical protein
MGLRERRRRQTSADIRDAAVRLARERGFDKVTIEEICVEARISQIVRQRPVPSPWPTPAKKAEYLISA